jgi:hypothetical protein
MYRFSSLANPLPGTAYQRRHNPGPHPKILHAAGPLFDHVEGYTSLTGRRVIIPQHLLRHLDLLYRKSIYLLVQ